MAITIAQVPHPGAKMTEFPVGPWKGRMVDLTLDSSYLTTGEVLTAVAMGWKSVIGAIQIYPFSNAAGTLSVGSVVKPNASQTQLAFQALYGPTSVGPYPEATSTNDLSLYTGRFLVLGY